ncbi:MAG: hypothetical protein AB1782_08915, partial [Cyanobacteriota bacterium]
NPLNINTDLDSLIEETIVNSVKNVIELTVEGALEEAVKAVNDAEQSVAVITNEAINDSGANNYINNLDIDSIIADNANLDNETTQIIETSESLLIVSSSDKDIQTNTKPFLYVNNIPESSLNLIYDSGDEPINIDSNKIMSFLFNLCQGDKSCNEIMTGTNLAILEKVINIDIPQLEFNADTSGTQYIAFSNYHPSGIKGYLITINLIENINKINSSNQPLLNSILKSQDSKLSYLHRHPITKERIYSIDKYIISNNLSAFGLNRINKNTYYNFLNQPDKDLLLTPKVYEFLNKLHIIKDKELYFNAIDE